MTSSLYLLRFFTFLSRTSPPPSIPPRRVVIIMSVLFMHIFVPHICTYEYILLLINSYSEPGRAEPCLPACKRANAWSPCRYRPRCHVSAGVIMLMDGIFECLSFKMNKGFVLGRGARNLICIIPLRAVNRKVYQLPNDWD